MILRRVGLAVSGETAPACFCACTLAAQVHPGSFRLFSQSSASLQEEGFSWPIPPIALPLPLQIHHPPSILHVPLAHAHPPRRPRFARRVAQTATRVGVRRMLRRVLAPPVAHVPVAPAVVSDQAMAVPAVVVVQGSAVDHTVPAMALMRLQMARHVTPRR
jgi:hypothetical protein